MLTYKGEENECHENAITATYLRSEWIRPKSFLLKTVVVFFMKIVRLQINKNMYTHALYCVGHVFIACMYKDCIPTEVIKCGKSILLER